MKIIDLLNKIANDEEVPVKIKYKGRILYYDSEDSETNNYNATFNYYDKDEENALFEGWIGQYLNDEVEIIEEDNKIEKIERLEYSTNFNREEFMLYQNILAVNGNVNDLIDRVYELEKRYEKQDK